MLAQITKTAAVLAICVTVTACQFHKETEEEKAAKLKTAVKSVLNESNPKTTSEDLAMVPHLPLVVANEPEGLPNQAGYYKVTFKWSGEGSYKLKVQLPQNAIKTSLDNEQAQATLLTSLKDFYLIYNSPGEKTIQFDYYDLNSKLINGVNSKVVIPQDMQLSGPGVISTAVETFATDQKKIARLFLSSSFDYQLNGGEIRLKANTVIAQKGARITSFGANLVAQDDSSIFPNGLGKGLLHIEAINAQGELLVDLRGQNGANGKGGTPWTTRAENGRKGEPGVAIVSEPICRGVDGACHGVPDRCAKNPTNGQPGQDGQPGRDGYDGGNGGSGGAIHIVLVKKSEFTIYYNISGGAGGAPGEGADGQLGGLGGEPGERTNQACSPASRGAEGQSGAQGKWGKRGQDGLRGNFTQDHLDKFTAKELLD